MALTEVIAQIDAEITKLQQARALLTGSTPALKPGRGRPRGSKNSPAKVKGMVKAPAPVKGKRKLSAEGRKAIADAMKKRWAEKKQATK